MKTLGDYRALAALMGGEDCAAVKFFERKIAAQGKDEPVLADEGQMIFLIASMLGKSEP